MERQSEIQKFINETTFMSYDETRDLALNEELYDALTEWGEYNYYCVKNMFENFYNKKMVRDYAQKIADGLGGLETLQENFYIYIRVIRRLLYRHYTDRDLIQRLFIHMREEIKRDLEGIAGWKN